MGTGVRGVGDGGGDLAMSSAAACSFWRESLLAGSTCKYCWRQEYVLEREIDEKLMHNFIVISYKIFSKFHTKIHQNFNKIFSC